MNSSTPRGPSTHVEAPIRHAASSETATFRASRDTSSSNILLRLFIDPVRKLIGFLDEKAVLGITIWRVRRWRKQLGASVDDILVHLIKRHINRLSGTLGPEFWEGFHDEIELLRTGVVRISKENPQEEKREPLRRAA